MFNFAGITHVIENPKEHAPGYVYSLVGSVPAGMMDVRTATTSDVMAGRARRTQGGLIAYTGRKWETVEQIKAAAAHLISETGNENAVRLCDIPGCACRLLGF